jgi:hypothetical protein
MMGDLFVGGLHHMTMSRSSQQERRDALFKAERCRLLQ